MRLEYDGAGVDGDSHAVHHLVGEAVAAAGRVGGLGRRGSHGAQLLTRLHGNLHLIQTLSDAADTSVTASSTYPAVPYSGQYAWNAMKSDCLYHPTDSERGGLG